MAIRSSVLVSGGFGVMSLSPGIDFRRGGCNALQEELAARNDVDQGSLAAVEAGSGIKSRGPRPTSQSDWSGQADGEGEILGITRAIRIPGLCSTNLLHQPMLTSSATLSTSSRTGCTASTTSSRPSSTVKRARMPSWPWVNR